MVTIQKTNDKKTKKEEYIEAVGRRKSSVVRARFWPQKKEGAILVNERSYQDYFSTLEFKKIVKSPLELVGLSEKAFITLKVKGGGLRGQAEASRLAISRVLSLLPLS